MNINRMRFLRHMFPLLFLYAVIHYAVSSYSCVPFWDTWDRFMGILGALENGNFGAVFSAHGGHRITLARLLFLFDYYALKSHFSMLIAVNVALMAVSFTLFATLARKYLERHDAFCITIVGCLVFLLSQAENIRWEFQSQFFLAQIIPFAAFMLLAGSLDKEARIQHSVRFGVCVLLAMLANFTMGNGFLAILIILAALFFIKSNLLMKCTISIFSAASLMLVLTGRSSINAGDTFDLVKCIKYVLVYLGSPYFHVTQFYGFGNTAASYVSAMFGTIFIAVSLFYGWYWFKTRKIANHYALAALCMIAYVGLSAGLTAYARHQYSIGQATSERYTTPVLMGWAAMLILYWPLLMARSRRVLKVAGVAFMLVLLPYQLWTAKEKVDAFYYQVPFSGDVLMMSLLLGVEDEVQMLRLHPSPDRIRTVIKERQGDAGFFTQSKRYLHMQKLLAHTYELGDIQSPPCRLHLDETRNIGHDHFQYAGGWFKYSGHDGRRHLVLAYNDAHERVGYAVVGQPRPDVAQHFSDHEINVGFAGYFSEQALTGGTHIYLYAPEIGSICTHVMDEVEP